MYQLNYKGKIYCFDYETDIVEQVLIRHLNYFDFLIENINNSSLRVEELPYYGGEDEFRRGVAELEKDNSHYLFYDLKNVIVIQINVIMKK